MVKLAAERGGRIDYDRRQLVEALRSEEFQRIHWFYYCDDARGNTIRVFDEAFFEKYRHLYREPGHEPPSYVVLRGHDLGTEQEATKQKMRALFGELEKPPRGITAKGDEQCQQWFAERNSGNPVRAQQIAPAPAVGPANEPRTPTPTGRYTSLMEQTFLDATFFARLETLLEKHYQVILEG